MERTITKTSSDFDLYRTLRTLAVGSLDGDGAWWWATGTDGGDATLSLRRSAAGVEATAWGPGLHAALDLVPRLLGESDPYEVHGHTQPVRDLLASTRGMRLGSTGRVHEASVRAVLGQVVTTTEGEKSLRSIVRAYGTIAEGPRKDLRVFPQPEVLASLSYDEFHTHGVERRRASIVIEVSRRATRMRKILDMNVTDGLARLLAVQGVGPWTAAIVMGEAYGDRDAVLTGDYHLPNTVAWAMAGEARADDDRMLELLEPYRPYRRHIVMAIMQSGIKAPKYGPRTALRTHL